MIKVTKSKCCKERVRLMWGETKGLCISPSETRLLIRRLRAVLNTAKNGKGKRLVTRAWGLA